MIAVAPRFTASTGVLSVFKRENMTRPDFLRALLACLWLTSWLALPVRALAEADVSGKQWVVLVGVARHDEEQWNLKYSVRDVRTLREILMQRAGVAQERVLELSDDSDSKPTLRKLRGELPRFLAGIGKEDRVLIYFSCHGYLTDNGTYLIPRDVNSKSEQALKASALPASELRQWLNDCPAKVKFLVLDCCNAGGAKGLRRKGLAGEAVGKSIVPEGTEKPPRTMVLAGCKEKEESYEWETREQGIFTYWLCRGLMGGADLNGDGTIDVDEIYKYVHEHVQRTARLAGKSQTPARIYDPEVTGVPAVIRLLPEPREALCRRLAEEFDMEIRERRLKRIAVFEFRMAEGGERNPLVRAILPGLCAGQLRDRLASAAEGAYEVLPPEVMRAACAKVDMTSDDLGDEAKLKRLARLTGGMDGLVGGTLKLRPQNIDMQCELLAVTADSLARSHGLFPSGGDTEIALPDKLDLDLGKGVKLVLKRIPAKEKKFWMGAPPGEWKEVKASLQDILDSNSDLTDLQRHFIKNYSEQQHEVELSHDFYLGIHTVTQEQYEALTGENPSWHSPGGKGAESVKGLDTRKFPVEMVSWDDALRFCGKLNELPAVKKMGLTITLPLEAQWEFACRAGDGRKETAPFYFEKPSSSLSPRQADFDGNFPVGDAEKGEYRERPVQVGSFSANAFGLYDMHGNVCQWCLDHYASNWYAHSPKMDPYCGRGDPQYAQWRVLRGGSWDQVGRDCRAAARSGNDAAGRFANNGFRICAVRIR